MGVELLLLFEIFPFPTEEEDEEDEVDVGEAAEPTKLPAIVEGCCGEALAEAGGETKSGNATTEDGPTTRGALPLKSAVLSAEAVLLTGNADD